MNIAIVQVYDEAIKNYAEYSRMINSIYCAKQGYKYICWNYDLVPTEISVYYNKIQAIFNVMQSNKDIDYILYLDSDACIANHDIRIEEIIERQKGKEIVFGKDINGTNNGVFLIKNTEKMKEYLQKCFSDRRFYHTKFPEQSAMFNIIMSDNYKDLVGWEEAMFFNAYYPVYKDYKSVERYFDKDSFILHMPRLPEKFRIEKFSLVLRKLGIFCFVKGDK